jgi:hypothetical protein
LLQAPLIQAGLKPNQKVLVVAADGDSITPELLLQVGAQNVPMVVKNVGSMESFLPIRYGKGPLDNEALTRDVAQLAVSAIEEDPSIGAVLLECSDLPPYSWAVQAACGLPVYDFQTLIHWVSAAVLQKPYYGYL